MPNSRKLSQFVKGIRCHRYDNESLAYKRLNRQELFLPYVDEITMQHTPTYNHFI